MKLLGIISNGTPTRVSHTHVLPERRLLTHLKPGKQRIDSAGAANRQNQRVDDLTGPTKKMDSEEYKVTSELYEESDYLSDLQPVFDPKNVVSIFAYKDIPHSPKKDADGDLELVRKNKTEYNNKIEIEHSQSTVLNLVGLQIWRGALLLADWLIYNEKTLPGGYTLELGSGVGLTSIVSSMFRLTICTDIDVGGLLDLIKNNVKRNKSIVKHEIAVLELDFKADFSKEVCNLLPQVQLILAADVIYDDCLTDAFIQTVEKLLNVPPKKDILVALEKRYVFTVADLESCAPCYEYLKERLQHLKNASVQELTTNFPQYFKYDRVKELVLFKISSL